MPCQTSKINECLTRRFFVHDINGLQICDKTCSRAQCGSCKTDEADTKPVRRPCKFTETDLRRAMRAAKKENVLARIDLMPDGRICLIPITGSDATGITAPTAANEWDDAA